MYVCNANDIHNLNGASRVLILVNAFANAIRSRFFISFSSIDKTAGYDNRAHS